MTLLLMAVHTSLLLVMPFVLIGVINRTKAWWGGRKGPGLLQSFWDMRRLLYKRPVYSTTTTAVFRSGAYLVVVSAVSRYSNAASWAGGVALVDSSKSEMTTAVLTTPSTNTSMPVDVACANSKAKAITLAAMPQVKRLDGISSRSGSFRRASMRLKSQGASTARSTTTSAAVSKSCIEMAFSCGPSAT